MTQPSESNESHVHDIGLHLALSQEQFFETRYQFMNQGDLDTTTSFFFFFQMHAIMTIKRWQLLTPLFHTTQTQIDPMTPPIT